MFDVAQGHNQDLIHSSLAFHFEIIELSYTLKIQNKSEIIKSFNIELILKTKLLSIMFRTDY